MVDNQPPDEATFLRVDQVVETDERLNEKATSKTVGNSRAKCWIPLMC